jgi:hypothetical protein
MENSETSGWLDFSLKCAYILQSKYDEIIVRNKEIGKLLNHMIIHPGKY